MAQLQYKLVDTYSNMMMESGGFLPQDVYENMKDPLCAGGLGLAIGVYGYAPSMGGYANMLKVAKVDSSLGYLFAEFNTIFA